MREKAAGRDGDAIVVVDPHADLVDGSPPTRAGVPHRQGEAHRPRGRPGRSRHQPAGHPHLCRPRPHRRLGRARRQGTVGPVGAEDAVDPRTDRQDPPRGQRASRDERARAVHHPGRAAPAIDRRVPRGPAGESLRPLPPGVVGQGLRQVAPGVQVGGPGAGADPPILLRILEASSEPSSASPARPSTCGARSSTAASCWSRPRRGRSAGTWPRWSERPCSTWSTR